MLLMKNLKKKYVQEDYKMPGSKVASFEELLNSVSVKEIKSTILKPYENILKNLDNVYIFGIKELGKRVFHYCQKKGIKVAGFVDNNKENHNKTLFDTKIFAIEELLSSKQNVTIIIASTLYLYEILTRLENFGFKNLLPAQILSVYDEESFFYEPALDGVFDDLIENKAAYLDVYNKLADEKSKMIMENIVKFRTNFDFKLFHEAFEQSGKAYFYDEIIKLSDEEVFVDGGGFDGDTVLHFVEKTSNKFKKIYFFEPDKNSFPLALKNLKNYQNIEYFQKGLYSDFDTLRFCETGLEGSCISSDGNIEIEVVPLDSVAKENATFIKLDVEGSEEEALKGAKNHIKNSPKIAVCVYHKCNDLRKIPELILSLNFNYNLYLRHHTNSLYETVIYAIPKEK